jgi:hypothetical protein
MAGSHRQWNLVVNTNSSSNKRTQLAAGVANRVHISYTADGSAVEGAPCASWAGKCCVNRQQDGTYRCVGVEGGCEPVSDLWHGRFQTSSAFELQAPLSSCVRHPRPAESCKNVYGTICSVLFA